MPESRNQVRLSLRNYFSPAFQNSAHFETYVNIGSYLSDPAQYAHGVLELESRLEMSLGERTDTLAYLIEKELGVKFKSNALRDWLTTIRQYRHFGKPYHKDMVPYVPYAKRLYSKLLTGVLYEWEAKSGFTVDPGGKVDILFGNPGSLFNDQLRDGRPFKDVGAGKEHGESTHRIQWFIAGVGLGLPNAGSLFMDVKRWISVAAHLGINGAGAKRRYLWEFLFDRDGIPSNAAAVHFACVDANDFRAPSNLNRALMLPNAGCPILTWCLDDRYQKRNNEVMSALYVEKKAPLLPAAQQLGDATRRVMGMTGDGILDTDPNVVMRAQDGLFIRRNGVVVDIAWQRAL
jgi:hypothetical protein